MADPNITKVYLLNVPLENDYKHTLYFAKPSDQTAYFNGKRVSGCEFTDFSYQRKDGFIRVPVHYDTLVSKGVNYVMYQNTAYKTTHDEDGSDRWFYAFITDMVYKDDGRTDIFIETDVMQTWMFDITVKSSFVEREHCEDDTVGLHTYPELVETGEYVCNQRERYDDFDEYGIVVGSTRELYDIAQANVNLIKKIGGESYNGVFSGVKYYYFSFEDAEANADYLRGTRAISLILARLAEKGISDCITCMFVCPKSAVMIANTTRIELGSDETVGGVQAPSLNVEISTVSSLNSNGEKAAERDSWINPINKPINLNGHTPKNNKLLTYPYCYLQVSNNIGGSGIYQYELFDDEQGCSFTIYSAITPGCSIRLVPNKYKNVGLNNEYGLNGGKFPICNWNTDVYTNWLTQNSINIGVQIASGVTQVASGAVMAFTGGGLGAGIGGGSILGGVNTILSTIGQVHQQSFTSPQAEGNLNSGDVTFSFGNMTFTAYAMSVKKEYAQIIDNYFTMFGYKTCLVKVPNKNHRPYFWYTKTIDANIDGKIPNKDMQKVKDCYNNGITFWKSTAKFGDYSQDNSIN